MQLVPHDAPGGNGLTLKPYDDKDGLETVVHQGHGHHADYETVWEPTTPQTRIPTPGASRMSTAALAAPKRLSKNGRGKALNGLDKEPW